MDLSLIYKNIETVEKEINEIFNMVSTKEEISFSKLCLLNVKIKILDNLLENLIVILNEKSIKNLDDAIKNENINLYLFVISIILIYIIPIIGILLNLVSWFIKFKLEEKIYSNLEDMKKIKKINDKANSLSIIIDNCYSFLNYHNTMISIDFIKKIENSGLENEYMEISSINENISEEIKSEIIKMLQESLNTDEKDLTKLIQMATSEEMVKSLEKVKIRVKKLENDEK